MQSRESQPNQREGPRFWLNPKPDRSYYPSFCLLFKCAWIIIDFNIRHWKYAHFCRISGFWDSSFAKPASRFQQLILLQCYLEIWLLKYLFIYLFVLLEYFELQFYYSRSGIYIVYTYGVNFFIPSYLRAWEKKLFMDFKIFTTVVLRVELCHPAFIWNSYRHALHLYTC